MLRALCIQNPGQDWEEVLPACLFPMRTAWNRHIGQTPHFLLHGREAATPIDVIFPLPEEKLSPHPYADQLRACLKSAFHCVREQLKLSVERARQGYTGKLEGQPLNEGDLLWLFTPTVKPGDSKKLTPMYTGPWRVSEKISDVLFQVTVNGGWNTRTLTLTASID